MSSLQSKSIPWAKFAGAPVGPITVAMPVALSMASSVSLPMSWPYIWPLLLMAIATTIVPAAAVMSPISVATPVVRFKVQSEVIVPTIAVM